ncbi:MAG: lipoyl synthase [Melioribacteraceae bacterium]|nr:lipoyl synthase [Melioribacteraceae bacterium]
MINKHQQEFKESIEAERGNLGKKPDWLRVRLPSGKNYKDVHKLMRDANLNTVCEEARCPNMGECWNARTATFMILGEICTRTCGFCNVKTGKPPLLDKDEPRRVAEAVEKLNLRHAVITSVNRDELKDGGASIFSETIRLINETSPDCTIEILIPDFLGNEAAFEKIMENPPDILNHNLETVPRIYHAVRPQAKYQRSLDLIKWFKNKGLRTKSGIMVGIGEKNSEVFEVMQDLKDYGCDIMTIGQYLQPTQNHLPLDRYVTLEEFEMFSKKGTEMGFLAVESSPLVRSSYHADKHARL